MSCMDCGMPTPNRLCQQCRLSNRAEERARARYDDEEDEEEVRTDGGKKAFAPTDDTPLSYQMRCGVCESIIGMSARFCKHCGAKVDHTEGNEDAATRRLLTGGDR